MVSLLGVQFATTRNPLSVTVTRPIAQNIHILNKRNSIFVPCSQSRLLYFQASTRIVEIVVQCTYGRLTVAIKIIRKIAPHYKALFALQKRFKVSQPYNMRNKGIKKNFVLAEPNISQAVGVRNTVNGCNACMDNTQYAGRTGKTWIGRK